ncbi:MAG: pirin-like C-terminal cupin domain-containing protein [Polyangiaceae bacterium]|jgi:redox-sensitive bicupin YhaK (pirin superfamily)
MGGSREVVLEADVHEQRLSAAQALAASGGPGTIKLKTASGANAVLLSGAEIHEPVVVQGSFIMNDAGQIEEATERYRSGRMGSLTPYGGT